MLYPMNLEPFDQKNFVSPPAAFRGVPFWAWNCRVTKEKIARQTEYFRQMGMGGAMVHPRTGMDTEYLSGEYLDLVAFAEEELRAKGMTCWLYDEERFPSGCAGGIVTRDMRFRARQLVLTREEPSGFCRNREEFDSLVRAGEKPKGYFLCSYDIQLENGCLLSYSRLPSGGNWHALMELWPESPWFNGESYVDVFSPEAVDEFIRVTHERYFGALKGHIGADVPAIFTDEPHMKGKYCMAGPDSARATLAFTEEINASFREQWGREILDVLPELIWEKADSPSVWRYRYHDHVTECFASAYGDRIGEWCLKHNIAYTGHFLSERTLFSQTLALGETMRQYRSQQLPGIDILAGQLEITTAKQAESVRRQMGREGLVCEMYGVLEWDVSFRQHKLQGDWLAALGVTTRVHHLAFMSMGGEAKRDWPAAIGWQSPWWDKYGGLETYFARVNSLLTRGRAVTRVAVMHPIESFWLLFGPNSQTLERREQMDEQFESLAQWLLYGGVDFDYLSESLLPILCPEAGAPLKVGACAYDCVIVPPILTIRKTTLERLSDFVSAGGRLVCLGDAPRLVDGAPSDEARALWQKACRLPMERAALMEEMQDLRDVEIRFSQNGKRSDNLFYQLRQDGEERTLFVCHVKDEPSPRDRVYSVRVRGLWSAERMDALTGETKPMGGTQQSGFTSFAWACSAQDSLLLRLRSGSCSAPQPLSARQRAFMTLSQPDSFSLDEPNALLLDRFAYALDDGEWHEAEDVLRADNALRAMAGLPRRDGDQVQPWLTKPEKPLHTAHLMAVFRSDRPFGGLRLAMEQPGNALVELNGAPVKTRTDGWYVDEYIPTLPLPRIRKGENVLVVHIPLTKRTNIESMYILGTFGVEIRGTDLCLTDMPEDIRLDDLTRQGFPFYTGNVTYRFRIEPKALLRNVCLHIPRMASPVAEVRVDGVRAGMIAWQPYSVRLPALSTGSHLIELTACGSRYNGFGTLHNANPHYKWYGPAAYRTTGDEWTDNYLLRPSYILSPIELTQAETDGGRQK